MIRKWVGAITAPAAILITSHGVIFALGLEDSLLTDRLLRRPSTHRVSGINLCDLGTLDALDAFQAEKWDFRLLPDPVFGNSFLEGHRNFTVSVQQIPNGKITIALQDPKLAVHFEKKQPARFPRLRRAIASISALMHGDAFWNSLNPVNQTERANQLPDDEVAP